MSTWWKLRTATNRWQTLSHNEYTSPLMGFEFTTLLVIATDCKSNCKFNYHMITTTRVPNAWGYQRDKKNMWKRVTDDTMAIWKRVKRQQSTKFYTETLRLNNRKALTQILQKVINSFSTSDILYLYDLSIGLWNWSDGVVFCCISLYI